MIYVVVVFLFFAMGMTNFRQSVICLHADCRDHVAVLIIMVLVELGYRNIISSLGPKSSPMHPCMWKGCMGKAPQVRVHYRENVPFVRTTVGTVTRSTRRTAVSSEGVSFVKRKRYTK